MHGQMPKHLTLERYCVDKENLTPFGKADCWVPHMCSVPVIQFDTQRSGSSVCCQVRQAAVIPVRLPPVGRSCFEVRRTMKRLGKSACAGVGIIGVRQCLSGYGGGKAQKHRRGEADV